MVEASINYLYHPFLNELPLKKEDQSETFTLAILYYLSLCVQNIYLQDKAFESLKGLVINFSKNHTLWPKIQQKYISLIFLLQTWVKVVKSSFLVQA